MSLLAGINYDPAVAVQQSCASALAMTALDTTNLRLTFTPNTAYVMVRASVPVGGGTGGYPAIHLGILEGATVVARLVPVNGQATGTQNATSQAMQEFAAVVPLTVASHTWDLAYGVESIMASSNLQYGGPDNNSGANAYGGVTFEVWDTVNLLGACLYDPAAAVTSSGTAALKAMTALDTTNLRLTFTAPASGRVFWRQRYAYTGSTSSPMAGVMLGMLESTTVVARKTASIFPVSVVAAASPVKIYEASGFVSGVSAGSHTWDAAYAVQLTLASSKLAWGGPNNTTVNDAYGAAVFELWAA